MIKFALIFSLFATPLWAGELQTTARLNFDEALIEALKNQLTETTTSWMSMNESERLAHAFAIVAAQTDFRAALGLTDEEIVKLKTGQIATSTELKQQITSVAIVEFSKQLKEHRHQLKEVGPGHPVALKVGIELMKGITAANLAMLTAWIGFSGAPLESVEILTGMKVLSLMSALYATYRPVAVINILTRNGQSEKVRLEKLEKLIANSPIPEKLWQNWFLIQVFGSKTAADDCYKLLSDPVN